MPSVSVIVVSHGRPALLRRALVGIGQLFYRPFEVVVIADPEGLNAISDLPFAGRIKTAPQKHPNISAARNLGADLAAGEILAFIDDDAVPEPTWLTHLVFPLLDPDIAASTGSVLGRNGISVQWANRCVDQVGVAHQVAGPVCPAHHAIKLEGTNMAIRRDALVALGGFDERFSFYLDETDLAWRLKASGRETALAPQATVHHGFAASSRRREDRVPTDLTEIGRSSALYLAKHAQPDQIGPALTAVRREQEDRLSRLKRAGKITAGGGRALLASFDAGARTPINPPANHSFPPPAAFHPLLDTSSPEPLVLSGRWFSRARLMRTARQAAAQGRSVTVVLLDHTLRAHRVTFLPEGIWLQSGGLFGRSKRSTPRFTLWTFSKRIRAEVERLAGIRWV